MLILATADLHGNHASYHRLVAIAAQREVEAIVLAGDLLGAPPGFPGIEESQRADADDIVAILRPVTIPVLYIAGNDDLVPLIDTPEHLEWLHGRRVELGDYNFVGYQYSLPFMGGVNERSEVEIARDLFALEPLMDERTILVTHAPAAGILDGSDHAGSDADPWRSAGIDIPAGSPAIRAAIERRRVHAHLHGHIHRCFGRDGNRFNVASGPEHLRAVLLDLPTLVHVMIDEGGRPPDPGVGRAE